MCLYGVYVKEMYVMLKIRFRIMVVFWRERGCLGTGDEGFLIIVDILFFNFGDGFMSMYFLFFIFYCVF